MFHCIRVLFIDGPKISSPKDGDNITVTEHDTFTLECVVTAMPNGTVGWIRDGIFTEGNTLSFENVSKDNATHYTCHAFNEIHPCDSDIQQRKSEVTIYLNVLCKFVYILF